MTVRAVLFDAGNTLLWLDYGLVAEAAGGSVTEAQIRRADAETRRALDAWMLPELEAGRCPPQEAWMGGRSMADVLLDFLPLDPRARRSAARKLEEFDREMRLWGTAAPGARELLDSLRNRFRLAVVSNSDGRVAELLGRAGLADALETIVDSGIEGVSKPSPEIFRRALARLGEEPRAAVYLGDIYSVDMVACAQVGLKGVLVDRTGLYDGFACPRIERLAELEPRVWS